MSKLREFWVPATQLFISKRDAINSQLSDEAVCMVEKSSYEYIKIQRLQRRQILRILILSTLLFLAPHIIASGFDGDIFNRFIRRHVRAQGYTIVLFCDRGNKRCNRSRSLLKNVVKSYRHVGFRYVNTKKRRDLRRVFGVNDANQSGKHMPIMYIFSGYLAERAVIGVPSAISLHYYLKQVIRTKRASETIR